jgi:hypothetical protein
MTGGRPACRNTKFYPSSTKFALHLRRRFESQGRHFCVTPQLFPEARSQEWVEPHKFAGRKKWSYSNVSDQVTEDVARVVRLLLELGNYITGQVITVDGGLTLRRDRG